MVEPRSSDLLAGIKLGMAGLKKPAPKSTPKQRPADASGNAFAEGAAGGAGSTKKAWRPPLLPSLEAAKATYLFLDVDGVLHPTASLTKETWFDERCMSHLKRVVDTTQCQIILSSTWRLDSAQRTLLDETFAELGIATVAGRTKQIEQRQAETVTRAEEICQWMIKEGIDIDGACWVVLDDMRMEATWAFNSVDGQESPWSKLLDGHFVRTDEVTGLTKEDADRAIQILRTQHPATSPSTAQHRAADPGGEILDGISISAPKEPSSRKPMTGGGDRRR